MKRGKLSEKELKYIQANVGFSTAEEIAAKLDRTPAFIQKMMDEVNTSTTDIKDLVEDEKKPLSSKNENIPRTHVQSQMNPRGPGEGITVMTPGIAELSDELPKATGFKSRYAKNIRNPRG